MFILGDAADARAYSGPDLGSRWLCRLGGAAIELPIDWPDGITWKFWATEEEARGMDFRLLYDRVRGAARWAACLASSAVTAACLKAASARNQARSLTVPPARAV